MKYFKCTTNNGDVIDVTDKYKSLEEIKERFESKSNNIKTDILDDKLIVTIVGSRSRIYAFIIYEITEQEYVESLLN